MPGLIHRIAARNGLTEGTLREWLEQNAPNYLASLDAEGEA